MTDKVSMPRVLVGKVLSNKMKDTIVVQVERFVMHGKYKKYVRKTTKLHAHDQGNSCQIGDLVEVKECRPISKTKTWTLLEIKERMA